MYLDSWLSTCVWRRATLAVNVPLGVTRTSECTTESLTRAASPSMIKAVSTGSDRSVVAESTPHAATRIRPERPQMMHDVDVP